MITFFGFLAFVCKAVLVLILLGLAVYTYGCRPVSRFRLRKVPGPPGQWLAGHIFPAKAVGNHVYYQQMSQKYGPIFKTWGICGAEIIVTSPKLVRQVLQNNHNRSDFINLNSRNDDYNRAQILAARNNKSKAIRAAWAPFFFKDSLSHLAEMMNKKAVSMVDRLELAAQEGSLINVSSLTIDLTLDVISTAAFGVDIMGQKVVDNMKSSPEAKRAEEMRQDTCFILESFGGSESWWYVMFVAVPELSRLWYKLAGKYPDDQMRKTRDAEKRLVATILELVVEHKQALKERGIIGQPAGKPKGTALEFGKPSELTNGIPRMGVQDGSFLDCLIRNRDRTTEQPFEDLEIVAFATAMLIAGFETTASTLAFAIYNLAKSPEKARALEAEVDAIQGDPSYDKIESLRYCDAIMRETLRMYPSASIGNREAAQDMVLDGYKIPKGTGLRTAFYAMQRDPEIWDQPDTFIPERWIEGTKDNELRPKDAWAAFGDGPRQCMGYKFVIEEGIVALVHIFRKFSFKLGPDQDPLPLRQVMTLTPRKGVWVTVHKRSPPLMNGH